MYKFETVRAEIRKLDGGAFQALGQQYARLKFNLKKPVFLGTSPGTLKTVKGTPDAYFEDNKGNFVFVECGSITTEASKAVKKIREDIQKCLHVINKSQPKLAVSKIICCYAYSHLTPQQVADLKNLDQDRVMLIGPDEIAEDICNQFFSLAEQYLNLPYPNQSILDSEKFIQLHRNNAYATPLDNKFIGRDAEFNEILQALQSEQTVVVYGKSGCGKTRLALEVATHFCHKKEIPFSIIKSTKNTSLQQELQNYYTSGSKYIILVDDIDQLFDITELIEFCLLNKNVHLICTVRNYALPETLKSLEQLGHIAQIHLEPIHRDSIKSILREQYLIDNQIFLNQITKVSKGNLRLAILAAEKAKGDFYNIANCKDLLELCYENMFKQWPREHVLACEIAALLGTHPIEKNENLKTLEDLLSFSHEDYRDACIKLCENGTLDMPQEYRSISLDEQNLRDYFIYRCLVMDRKLSFENLWFLKDGQSITQKALNTLFEVFNDENLFDFTKNSIESLWPKLSDSDKYSAIAIFKSFIEVDALTFLRNRIQNLPSNTGDYSSVGISYSNNTDVINSNILKSLFVLLDGDHIEITIDLIFEHLSIDSSPVEDFCRLFYCRLKPILKHEGLSYLIVEKVLDKFESKVKSAISDSERALLLLFSKSIMDDNLKFVQRTEINEINILFGTHPFSEYFLNLRRRCLDCLGKVDLSMQQEILLSYAPSYGNTDDKSLANETYKIIYEYLDLHQDITLQDKIQVINLERSMKRSGHNFCGINDFVNSSWQNRFISAAISIENNESDYNHFGKLIAEASEEHINQLIDTTESYPDLSEENKCLMNAAIKLLFDYLRKSSPSIFRSAIYRYLQKGLSPDLAGNIIVDYFFDEADICKGRNALLCEVINNHDLWAFEYDLHCILNKDRIPDGELFLESFKRTQIPLHPKCIWKADKISPGLFLTFVSVVMLSSQKNTLNYSKVFPTFEIEEGIEAVKRSIEKSDGLQMVEEVILRSVKHSDYFAPKATLRLLLQKDPEYLRKIVPALLTSSAEVDWIIDIIWSDLFSIKDIKILLNILCGQLSPRTISFFGKLISHTENYNKHDEALLLVTKLRENLTDPWYTEGFYGALPLNIKIEFALKLAAEDAPWDQILPLASGSQLMESWVGSYVSVLEDKREAAKTMRKHFNDKGISKYDLDFIILDKEFDRRINDTVFNESIRQDF